MVTKKAYLGLFLPLPTLVTSEDFGWIRSKCGSGRLKCARDRYERSLSLVFYGRGPGRTEEPCRIAMGISTPFFFLFWLSFGDACLWSQHVPFQRIHFINFCGQGEEFLTRDYGQRGDRSVISLSGKSAVFFLSI
ncbi:hypothetical protein AVEN_188809-1 [Araneus ventricosus]|uniref:Secreted protein n=1 Tax=Araneus ventricosus TaxID=182803 RepID=A0A4Y2BSY6_ARAVE|nr:hypothetical protein AVEN_188809-1 [Araneus ventricosus]